MFRNSIHASLRTTHAYPLEKQSDIAYADHGIL